MVRPFELDQKSRPELIEEARRHGVERPERMTRVELVDEIIRLTTAPEDQADARGLFGVARSMLASVVESGLNLADAASVIRGGVTTQIPVRNQTPVATVTLAEIYAAQGHKERALAMLEDVLTEEPEHEEAQRVLNLLRGDQPESPDEDSSSFVDTEGEEIRTGKPPVVQQVEDQSPTDEDPELAESSDPELAESSDPELAESSDPELAESSDPAPPVDEEPAAVAALADQDEGAESPPATADASEEPPPPAELSSPVLVTRRAGGTLRLYWELSPSSLARCAIDSSEGAPAIRIVAISPSGARPTRLETAFPLADGEVLTETTGRSSLGGFDERAVIVAALGWSQDEDFLPLCVGRQLEELQAGGESAELCARALSHLSL